MTNNDNQQSKEMIRVSISEGARLFGVNSLTIRRALKNQEITYVVVAGRYKINFESLVKWSQKHTTIKNKLNSRGIGQFVDKWKIHNPLFSPNPKSLPPQEEAGNEQKITAVKKTPPPNTERNNKKTSA